eukprot:CAMPEP_0194200548 /NCGR_PEP_ID=MMETSP0156-20130528/1107_1 /TAXON_ID=33649 /ORGANISM="Thalassionema nitzschioides, Strain L26-B" /LENGTH=78 /DNA_ID=CAMNT_0038925557 /DNA_START=64 /DNA_END=300 /DNA_ORIENTATION=-
MPQRRSTRSSAPNPNELARKIDSIEDSVDSMARTQKKGFKMILEMMEEMDGGPNDGVNEARLLRGRRRRGPRGRGRRH